MHTHLSLAMIHTDIQDYNWIVKSVDLVHINMGRGGDFKIQTISVYTNRHLKDLVRSFASSFAITVRNLSKRYFQFETYLKSKKIVIV